jgi:hypothetical protein
MAQTSDVEDPPRRSRHACSHVESPTYSTAVDQSVKEVLANHRRRECSEKQRQPSGR